MGHLNLVNTLEDLVVAGSKKRDLVRRRQDDNATVSNIPETRIQMSNHASVGIQVTK